MFTYDTSNETARYMFRNSRARHSDEGQLLAVLQTRRSMFISSAPLRVEHVNLYTFINSSRWTEYDCQCRIEWIVIMSFAGGPR